jgi:intracellular sulfur oxidation DsrE/DsrF family protein
MMIIEKTEDEKQWSKVISKLESHYKKDLKTEIASMFLEKVVDELQAASRYIEENEVIHLKTKRDIPTVIEYKGRRYILDHADHRKG